MHQNRIRGLQRRLRVLTQKLDNGYPPWEIDRDRERTETELETLLGLARRNLTLAAEAPALAAAADAQIERRRRLRERIQFTPGQGPTVGSPERSVMEGA